MDIDEVKSNIRAILMTEVQEGVRLKRLMREYEEFIGEPLNYFNFGCTTLTQFLKTKCADACRIVPDRDFPGEYKLFVKSNKDTEHIEKLQLKSKKKKKKPVVRTLSHHHHPNSYHMNSNQYMYGYGLLSNANSSFDMYSAFRNNLARTSLSTQYKSSARPAARKISPQNTSFNARPTLNTMSSVRPVQPAVKTTTTSFATPRNTAATKVVQSRKTAPPVRTQKVVPDVIIPKKKYKETKSAWYIYGNYVVSVLEKKKFGMMCSDVEAEYEDKFKESLPPDWVDELENRMISIVKNYGDGMLMVKALPASERYTEDPSRVQAVSALTSDESSKSGGEVTSAKENNRSEQKDFEVADEPAARCNSDQTITRIIFDEAGKVTITRTLPPTKTCYDGKTYNSDEKNKWKVIENPIVNRSTGLQKDKLFQSDEARKEARAVRFGIPTPTKVRDQITKFGGGSSVDMQSLNRRSVCTVSPQVRQTEVSQQSVRRTLDVTGIRNQSGKESDLETESATSLDKDWGNNDYETCRTSMQSDSQRKEVEKNRTTAPSISDKRISNDDSVIIIDDYTSATPNKDESVMIIENEDNNKKSTTSKSPGPPKCRDPSGQTQTLVQIRKLQLELNRSSPREKSTVKPGPLRRPNYLSIQPVEDKEKDREEDVEKVREESSEDSIQILEVIEKNDKGSNTGATRTSHPRGINNNPVSGTSLAGNNNKVTETSSQTKESRKPDPMHLPLRNYANKIQSQKSVIENIVPEVHEEKTQQQTNNNHYEKDVKQPAQPFQTYREAEEVYYSDESSDDCEIIDPNVSCICKRPATMVYCRYCSHCMPNSRVKRRCLFHPKAPFLACDLLLCKDCQTEHIIELTESKF